MKIGISINQFNYSEAFCREMLDNGIEYAEVSLGWGFEVSDSEALAKKVLSNGIRIWSYHVPFGPVPQWDPSNPVEEEREGTIQRVLPYFDLAKETGASVLVLHASFEPIPDKERAVRIQAFHKSLAVLEKKSKETGVLLCVENLPRTCMGNTSEEMKKLVDGYEAIGLCCDLNHMLTETTEYYLEQTISKVRTLHISDYDGIDERHWVPGEGIINWPAVKALLRDYQGVYILEIRDHKDGSDYTPSQLKEAVVSVLG